MDLKPLMRFATEHQKSILMIYILILIVSALNFICIIVASKRAGSFNPASPTLAISNAFLAMASTLLLALCVLFLDTSKTLYDSFDYLVSGALLPITMAIDAIAVVGIFVLAFVVIHYRRKV